MTAGKEERRTSTAYDRKAKTQWIWLFQRYGREGPLDRRHCEAKNRSLRQSLTYQNLRNSCQLVQVKLSHLSERCLKSEREKKKEKPNTGPSEI